jgi:hypothetical protein
MGMKNKKRSFCLKYKDLKIEIFENKKKQMNK